METKKSNTEVVNETLKETEVGVVILKYKTPLLIALIVIVFGVIAGGFYFTHQESAKKEFANKLFHFKEDVLVPYTEDKKTSEEFNASMQTFLSASLPKSAMSDLVLMSDLLAAKEKNSEALQLLEKIESKFLGVDGYFDYLVVTRLAVLYENQGDWAKAAAVLEKAANSKVKILAPKVYLDLGRAYAHLNDTVKATQNFEYVINNFSDEYMTKLARIFLSELKK